ncbi:MAG: response regulator [Geminicoccaceae bacterium]
MTAKPANQTLRHLARAVVADRTLGDELLRLVETRLRQRDTPPHDTPDAVALFVETWRELRQLNGAARAFSDRSLAAALPAPPSNERFMLLLVDTMGLDQREASRAMRVSAKEGAELLEEARRWALGQFHGSALIIEDEPLIAAELRAILASMGVNVIAAARTAEQAVDLVKASEPDLLLADYNLDGERSGVDAVREIQEQVISPVVFITGYPDRVLAGNEVEPDFVLAKPYSTRAVRAAVAHCLSTERAPRAE